MAREDETLDSSGLHHVVGYLLAIGSVATRRAFQRRIGKPFGLRPVEFTLLALLAGNPAASPKQLAQSLSLPPPNVTVLLDRLVARGLVERRRSPSDGRALLVLLTAAGSELASRTLEISRTMEAELLARLTPGEQAILRELLWKLAAGAG